MKKSEVVTLTVGEHNVPSSASVVNLGANFDCHLNMSKFVDKKVSVCLFYLKSIGKIRKYLDSNATKALVQAFVLSRLDYCNSLLYGCCKSSLYKLQLVQNQAARLISYVHKWDHITPVLRSLHWLPIVYRIQFKILVLVHNCLNGRAPYYLYIMLKQKVSRRCLRSSKSSLLAQKLVKSNSGCRAFVNSGPYLWNSLPENFKNVSATYDFKCQLKTYMFCC